MAKQPKRPAKPATAKKATKKTAKKATTAPAKKPKASRPAEVGQVVLESLPNDGASSSPAKPVRENADASRDFAMAAASMVANTRCTEVIILDVRGLSPVTDYLILATGTSGRQMRSAAEDVIEMAREQNYRPLSSSGFEGETWICVDFFDVLLHIFTAESRAYYDLEGLWGDAKRIDFDPAAMR